MLIYNPNCKEIICHQDCFNCIYNDCINDFNDYSNAQFDNRLDLEITRKSNSNKSSMYKYNHSDKGKARMNTYNNSEKGKARAKKFEQSEHRKAYKRAYDRKRYYTMKLEKEKLLCQS